MVDVPRSSLTFNTTLSAREKPRRVSRKSGKKRKVVRPGSLTSDPYNRFEPMMTAITKRVQPLQRRSLSKGSLKNRSSTGMRRSRLSTSLPSQVSLKAKKVASKKMKRLKQSMNEAKLHYRDLLMRRHFCGWVGAFIARLKRRMESQEIPARVRPHSAR
jgi:hypothetical protein